MSLTGVSDAIYRAGALPGKLETRVTSRKSSESPVHLASLQVRGNTGLTFLATGTSSFGIPLEGSERIIEVLIRRVGAGNTADTGLIRGEENVDSPSNSYPDAVVDFILTNNVLDRA